MTNQFLTNYTEVTFLDKIKDNLRRCKSFEFSVSFIKKAGLVLLFKDIEAAVNIDRKIGGTNAQMPEVKQIPEVSTNTPVNATYEPTKPHPEPILRKIRKSGTGCIYQINDHRWKGSFYPRLPNGKRKKFNVYAESRDQCETKLAEMIAEKKSEIAEGRAKQKEGAE